MIKLAAFLGNPGREYEGTRHNAPWLLLERLAPGASWQDKFKGRCAQFTPGASASSDKVVLIMPQTYMNLSGDCVGRCAAFFKISPPEILAVHDEVELPFGTLDFRRGGGLGGHKGLRSLAASLGTPDFYRLRIGVGRPARGDVASHVLSRFSREEEIFLQDYLKEAAAVLGEILASPVEKSLRNYGRLKVLDTA